MLPGWLTEEDLDVFVDEYAATGFTGGLNWYRNLDRNWELTAPWRDARVGVPGLYLAGDRDLVLAGRDPEAVVTVLRRSVPDLRHEILPGCGHWTQQERPAEVSAALIAFARSVES
jgi:pimeloyl-ACP methyl ester carboxylesterase